MHDAGEVNSMHKPHEAARSVELLTECEVFWVAAAVCAARKTPPMALLAWIVWPATWSSCCSRWVEGEEGRLPRGLVKQFS